MKLFFLLLVLLPVFSYARIEVAFVEIRNSTGNLLQLESGGRFAHVGIRYKNKWLHVHPMRGVELVYNFSDMGEIRETLVDDSKPDLAESDVSHLLRLRPDQGFNWYDSTSSYCSKLVAQILGIHPTPMTFDSEIWRHRKDLPRGAPGISPDEVYRELLRRGFQRLGGQSCRAVL